MNNFWPDILEPCVESFNVVVEVCQLSAFYLLLELQCTRRSRQVNFLSNEGPKFDSTELLPNLKL